MVKKISLFNHKGGVSKTTTTFNLGWMLALKGKRVIIVDCDPQCNLTGLVLGYSGEDELESLYHSNPSNNIKDGLAPAFESKPITIEPVECIQVLDNKNLFLLPGHIGLAEYEVTLGISQELSGSLVTLKNLPGSFSYLLKITAEKYSADYVLIDMSPSLSSINQNLFMTSDYFLIPTSPDFFSVMALNSLSRFIPKWHEWAIEAQRSKILREADYPFPSSIPKILGTIIQRYRLREGITPSRGYQKWIDQINDTVKNALIPQLKNCNMVLDEKKYHDNDILPNYCISSISDFNSLIAKSQEHNIPVFALKPNQLGQTGIVSDTLQTKITEFQETFSTFADKVIGLTSDGKNI